MEHGMDAIIPAITSKQRDGNENIDQSTELKKSRIASLR